MGFFSNVSPKTSKPSSETFYFIFELLPDPSSITFDDYLSYLISSLFYFVLVSPNRHKILSSKPSNTFPFVSFSFTPDIPLELIIFDC
jgi:hypothetical protein